ncbi:hypothetical protein Tco_1306129 [Tanacetum coccineum]
MPYDSPLSGGYTPKNDEGNKKLNELTELCIKLSEKVTSLEQDLKQTKQVYGKALTKLVKKVKHLEDQLKSTTKRRKAKVFISDKEEDLVSEDPSKQGRMSETEYEDVETEHTEEVNRLPLQKFHKVKSKVKKVLKFTLMFSVQLKFLQMLPEKRLSKATPEEEVLTVQKLNEKEMAKGAAREGSRKYGKIIRVRDVTEAYQSLKICLKDLTEKTLTPTSSVARGGFYSHCEYVGRGGLPRKISYDKQQSSCRQGECDEIYKPETSIVKDSDDDSTTCHGVDYDTQDNDEDEDDDEDELFDDNYGDDKWRCRLPYG